jgi:hypothetical protein
MEFRRFAHSLLVRYRQEIMVHGVEDRYLVEFYENGTFRECKLDVYNTGEEMWMARMTGDIRVFRRHIRSLNSLRGEEQDAIRRGRGFLMEGIEAKRDRVRASLRYSAVRLLSSPTFDYTAVDAIYKKFSRIDDNEFEGRSSKRVRSV